MHRFRINSHLSPPRRLARHVLPAIAFGIGRRTTVITTREYWAGKVRAFLIERRQVRPETWINLFKRLAADVSAHRSEIANPQEPGRSALDPREPLLWAYTTLAAMPSSKRQDYQDLPETGDKGLGEGQDAFRATGYVFKELATAHRCRLEWLGRLVRTLDADLAGFHFGPQPEERWSPESWIVSGYPCSVVPVDRAHRAEEGKPFERRGVVNHAIIPTGLGEHDIRLHLHSAVDPSAPRTDQPLRPFRHGAALFGKLTLDLHRADGEFLVTGVQPPGHGAAMRRHVADATRDRCDVVLWPELCVPEEAVADLVEHLEDTALKAAGRPSLLVPGSWHRGDGRDMRNRLVAVDGFGESVVDLYDKRRKFRLELAPEAIEPGAAISILVMEDRLVAFSICLDFCDDNPPVVYEHLDVDLVLVPSMGGRSTTTSHLRHIPQQQSTHAAQVVVVQQVGVETGHPHPAGEPLGYSIASPIRPGQEDPAKHVQNRPFRVL